MKQDAVTTTLSTKFQISVPKQVREQNNWRAGQKFAFVQRGDSVVLVPMPTIDDLRGIARGAEAKDYRDRNDRI